VENKHVPLAVLISGRGSNLRALIEACQDGRVQGRIAVVLSNRADALGLDIARQAGIPTEVVEYEGFDSRDAYDRAVVSVLRRYDVSLVCLAGFMRLIGREFCEAFPRAILNIHPSLLPSFPGLDATAQAIAHGVKVSGATVHFVTPELDSGPIVIQEAVRVEEGDTAARLATRILGVEHEIYPRAVQFVLERRWRIDGRRVVRVEG
jgi:phosphoribosylglycinamide formyltransferase-1